MSVTTKPAYSFDPVSGIYLGETVADLDPKVPDNWLFPAHSVATQPPTAAAGQIAVIDLTALTWTVETAWFSTPLYLTSTGDGYVLGSTVDGATFNGLGALPAWLTSAAKPSDLYVWTNGAWAVDPALESNSQAAAAQAQCATLMAQASLITSGLSDAYIAGILSDADVARYKAWAAYKLALTQISQQSGYPATITWPTPPAS